MNTPGWDEVLDLIDASLRRVEDAVAAGDDLPVRTPFEPPCDVMPAMSPGQRRRAEGLMRRQREVQGHIVAEIDATSAELGSMRQRRRAAVAYGRS